MSEKSSKSSPSDKSTSDESSSSGPKSSEGLKIRQAARSGKLKQHTSNLAPNHIQANLLVLPASVATSFRELCDQNPQSCPYLAHSTTPGNPHEFTPSLFFHDHRAETIDIRTDIPQYTVYENGDLIATKPDIKDEWTDESVAFLIGCSFSFEPALDKAGLTPRHWEMDQNVAMYKTTRALEPAGPFQNACQIVSMRPYRPDQIDGVVQVTEPYASTHGGPLAWGWNALEELGIKDIHKPDFGDTVEFREGEVPVFWGCGVTPQNAVIAAGSKIPGKVMAHKPGSMLVLDLTDEELFKSELS